MVYKLDWRHINIPEYGKRKERIEEYTFKLLRHRPGGVWLPFQVDFLGENLVTWPKAATRRLEIFMAWEESAYSEPSLYAMPCDVVILFLYSRNLLLVVHQETLFNNIYCFSKKKLGRNPIIYQQKTIIGLRCTVGYYTVTKINKLEVHISINTCQSNVEKISKSWNTHRIISIA